MKKFQWATNRNFRFDPKVGYTIKTYVISIKCLTYTNKISLWFLALIYYATNNISVKPFIIISVL